MTTSTGENVVRPVVPATVLAHEIVSPQNPNGGHGNLFAQFFPEAPVVELNPQQPQSPVTAAAAATTGTAAVPPSEEVYGQAMYLPRYPPQAEAVEEGIEVKQRKGAKGKAVETGSACSTAITTTEEGKQKEEEDEYSAATAGARTSTEKIGMESREPEEDAVVKKGGNDDKLDTKKAKRTASPKPEKKEPKPKKKK